MNGLDHLKRFLQRHYGSVAAVAFAFALSTYLLKQNYMDHQRDLLYWREVVLLWVQQPDQLFNLIVALIYVGLAMVNIQRCFLQVIEFMFSPLRDEYRYRRYADFLVRRLLHQLEAVTVHIPRQLQAHQLNDPITRRRCQLTSDAAYHVVALFRRDAAELLFKRQHFSGDAEVFVLHEEEQILQSNGYGTIELSVDIELLRTLLNPPNQTD